MPKFFPQRFAPAACESDIKGMTQRQTPNQKDAARTRRHRSGGADAMQPLEHRRLMSGTSFEGVAYDGKTLELRGPAHSGVELRVELDRDAKNVRGVVDGKAGDWVSLKKVRKISVVGGDDRDTLQVDSRLANTRAKLTAEGVDKLRAVPVLLTPRVRMIPWARLEAQAYGEKLAKKLHVKYGGLGDMTTARSIESVSKKQAAHAKITALPEAAAAEPVVEAKGASDATQEVAANVETTPEVVSTPAAPAAPAAPATPARPTTAAPARDATSPTARINAMASTVPAGQAVHLDVWQTTLRNGQWNDASFEWDFGDKGSDFNGLRGFSASHLYQKPGSYDVKLKVTDETGRTDTTTLKLTVTPEARTRVYVSGNGSDANNGTNEAKAVKTVGRALELLDAAGDHAALLFRAGQTFQLPQSLVVKHSDVVIRSYGGGAKPKLLWTGVPGPSPTMLYNDAGTRLLTVRDLDFQTTGPSGAHKDRATAFRPLGYEVTFYHNNLGDVTNAVLLNSNPKGVLVQGNTALTKTGIRAYFVWGQGERITVLGNKVQNSTREHVVRFSNAKGVTIAGNDFTNLDRRDQGDPYDYDKNVITMQWGSFGYVTDNKLHGPSEIGPLGAADGLNNKGARWDWAVWENNTFDVREITLKHGAEHVDIRNNLFAMNNNRSIYIEGFNSTYGRTNTDITVSGNVSVNNGDRGEFLHVAKGAKAIEVTDNVFVAPNLKVADWGSAGMSIDDNNLNGIVKIARNTWPTGRNSSGWLDGGVNFFAGGTDNDDWHDGAEWNGLPKIWGEVVADVAPAPLVTAVLNRHGVPVAQAA